MRWAGRRGGTRRWAGALPVGSVPGCGVTRAGGCRTLGVSPRVSWESRVSGALPGRSTVMHLSAPDSARERFLRPPAPSFPLSLSLFGSAVRFLTRAAVLSGAECRSAR